MNKKGRIFISVCLCVLLAVLSAFSGCSSNADSDLAEKLRSELSSASSASSESSVAENDPSDSSELYGDISWNDDSLAAVGFIACGESESDDAVLMCSQLYNSRYAFASDAGLNVIVGGNEFY